MKDKSLAFYAWIIGLAALALIILSYYLNKGVRDIVKGVIGPVVGYVGAGFKKTGVIVDQAATDYGYQSAVAETAGALSYDKVRSNLMKDYGLTFGQAVDRMPTRADFYNGATPDLTGLS